MKDVVEYTPAKTARDEERELAQAELETRREQLRLDASRKAEEKASKPKKPRAPKKEVYEVEEIQGKKTVRGEDMYLVKWVGWHKPQWEPEANVKVCV